MKNLKNKLFSVICLLLFCFPFFAVEKKSALELYNQAVEFKNDENWYEASQYFLEAVNINPAYKDAWFNLADCFYHLGDYQLASSWLEKAEFYDKENPDVMNLKGMLLLSTGEIDSAQEVFNSVLVKYPNNIDAHFGLAEIELYNGKFSGAEKQYLEALKRQSTNRKALLSLALLCTQTERFEQAEKFLKQAMQYYSGESEVHYLASVIYFMQKDYKLAENHARIAVEIDGDYEKAYEMLSSALYFQGRYKEVIDITDFLISRNRNNSIAWYLKGISCEKSGDEQSAIENWLSGLSINPQDELMRSQTELLVRNTLPLSDETRTELASYHVNKAKQYEGLFDISGAVYEYQRALLLQPTNLDARLSYANILKTNGMNEMYLNQLKFISENSKEELSDDLKYTIEAYDSLLQNTLDKKWNVDSFYLDKTRWNIAVFYTDDTSSFTHVDASRLLAQSCADIFSGVAITSVKTQVTPVSGYAQAFRNARDNNFDYFIIISVKESDDDITLSSKMYSGRTGTEAFSSSFFATGNDKLSTVLRRFRNSVLEKLTVRGKILQRNGQKVLVDLGKSENIGKDFEFNIVKKGKVTTADSGTGLYYRDSDVTGTLKIENPGEEVSEAVITSHGFYDRINVNDEIVLVKIPEQTSSPIDTVPNSDESGNAVTVDNSKGQDFMKEIKKSSENPALVELLKSVY